MKSTAQVKDHPIHPMLIVIPLSTAALTILSDLVFVISGDSFWARSSYWLITAAVVGAVLAAIAGATDFFTIREARTNRHAWYHALFQSSGLLVFIANWGIRQFDLMLPGTLLFAGLALSLIGGAIWIAGAWFGEDLVYVHHIGVVETPEEEEPGQEFRRAA